MKRVFQILTILFVTVFLVACDTTEKPPVEDDPTTFEVVFNANSGVIEGEAKLTIEDGKSVTEAMLPKATKEDHTFEGWFLTVDAVGDAVTFPVVISKDTTFYAGFKKVDEGGGDIDDPVVVKHKVTLDLKGGTGDDTAIEVESGKELLESQLPIVSKEGNTFIGWFMTVGGRDSRIRFPLVVSEDITIFVKWEEIVVYTFTVTFEANGGTLVGESEFVVEEGETVEETSIPTVTFENHEFLGWFLNKEGSGEAVTFPFKPVRNVTIHAVWKEIPSDFEGDNFKYLYEAEDATITGKPSYGNSFIENVEIASGGKSVGNMSSAGNSIKFKIIATGSGKATIQFVFSSSLFDWAGGQVLPDQTFSPTNEEVKLNDVVLTFEDQIVKGNNVPMGFNQVWTTVKIEDVDLIDGENTLLLTALGAEFPNFDCIYIKTEVELDGVKVEDVDEEEETPPVVEDVIYDKDVSYTLFVEAFPGGPASDKAVIKFTEPISLDAIDINTFEFSYEAAGWYGPITSILGNKEIFLSDADGNEVTDTNSNFITVTFNNTHNGQGFANNSGVFEYDFLTGRNRWINFETFKLGLGKGLTIGEEEYTKLNDEKVTFGMEIPKLAQWDLTGSHNFIDDTHGEITLTYAAYEPVEIAAGEKNPLVIWLHGAGEGGTDVRIALLGNEVTALSEEAIQNYFKSGEEVGTYILAVQTPTMWMDNGTGDYGNDSMYLDALWATIKAYVDGNDDIDTSRIYIGGCSNGGFMTMEMLLSDNEDYFAAGYPICHAYSYEELTDEQKQHLATKAIWFIHAHADTTVNPSFTNNVYVDLINLGATNVFYSYFEDVTYDGVTYMGHFSWIYAFRDLAIYIQPVSKEDGDLTVEDLDYTLTTKHTDYDSMWAWMAAQRNI